MSLLARRRAMMGVKKVFVHGTWEDLFRAIDEGTYATEYAVGEVLPLDLGSTIGNLGAEIVGFDADTLTDSTDKAPITFVTKYLTANQRRFNPTLSGTTEGTGTIGGWGKSELRSYLISTVLPLFPSGVKNRIVSVKKYSKIFDTSETAVNNDLTNDKIWIPSGRELGLASSSGESSGVSTYSGLNSNAKRAKTTPGGTSVLYRTRTAYSTINSWVCSAAGQVNSTAKVQNAMYNAIGFCVG